LLLDEDQQLRRGGTEGVPRGRIAVDLSPLVGCGLKALDVNPSVAWTSSKHILGKTLPAFNHHVHAGVCRLLYLNGNSDANEKVLG
jgi:hypothetical protein